MHFKAVYFHPLLTEDSSYISFTAEQCRNIYIINHVICNYDPFMRKGSWSPEVGYIMTRFNFCHRDRRGGKLLGCYSESHEDDITQVNINGVAHYKITHLQ